LADEEIARQRSSEFDNDYNVASSDISAALERLRALGFVA